DPPLRLVAESGVARPRNHLEIILGRNAQAVANSVVAREVGRRLGGSDEVVAGQPVFDGTRELAFANFGAELLTEIDRLRHRVLDTRLDPLGLVQLLGDADPQALQILRFRQLDRWDVAGGRLASVPPR